MKVATWIVGVLLAAGCVEATPSETSQQSYFERGVQPILLQKCAASGCHGNGGSAGALDVTSYDALAMRFDLLAPARPYPRLLAKAVGLEPHAAGALLDVGSDAFFVLQNWIDSGATDE